MNLFGEQRMLWPLDDSVLAVGGLQTDAMFSWLELQCDAVVAGTEVNIRRCAWRDDLSGHNAINVDR